MTKFNFYIIDEAKICFDFLSKPSNIYKNINDKLLCGNWINNFINLYNNRYEFLLISNIKKNNNNGKILVNDDYKTNYEKMKNNLSYLTQNNLELKEKYNYLEVEKKVLFKESILRLFLLIFQYLNEFDTRGIKINLWNYCLKSLSFSLKSFMTGIVILFCQYIWVILLLYETINNFTMTDNTSIIIISITSTIISVFYSYDSISSFINTYPLYLFILKLYKDYPSIILSNEEQELIYYKDRNITVKTIYIKFNFIADVLSNLILPIIIPILNTFIILNSDSAIDAILNCVAIFFIINIDEELGSINNFTENNLSINFSKWIIANIYCCYFPEFEEIFKNECTNWQMSFKRATRKFKNKIDVDRRTSVERRKSVERRASAERRYSNETVINLNYPNNDLTGKYI